MRAGQRKAARGKDGALTSVSERIREGLSAALFDFLGLRRGLWGEGLGIVTASTGSEGVLDEVVWRV